MKHYAEISVPETTRKALMYTTCDWESAYTVSDREVRIREGTSCPEGGQGTKVEYDICPKCFNEKLIPWLESQGAETRAEEWDY